MLSQQPESRSAFSRASRSDVIYRSLDHLLSTAHQHQSKGRVWQAMDIYWMLSKDHSGTAQSLEAEKSLLELAENCQRDGARSTARALYERLSELA